jgi:hypothetical protein
LETCLAAVESCILNRQQTEKESAPDNLQGRQTAMKSKSKPGPAGEKARRAFIQRIGTVAAASSLVGSAGSAQQTPASGQRPAAPGLPGAGFPQERDFIPQPGPEAKQPMPTINLGKHQYSSLNKHFYGILF